MPDCAEPATDDVTRALRVGTTLILPSESEPQGSRAQPVTALPSRSPANGVRRVAEYELLEMIGAGGMGRVFKARHTWLDKIVAIKLLPEGIFQQPQAVTRFLREAQMMACLDHPNVVRATDAGEAAGVHYLVAELVVGLDLARVVARGGRLNVADACVVTCQVASALQYAHQKGLVHRDIKPSNVMLTTDFHPDGIVKVLDFGLARIGADSEGLTASGLLLGTLDYMAPEQASDPRSVDVRADIYSLGCTLYFLLAGAPPFGGADFDSAASKLRAHLQTPPPEMARIRRDVPAGVLACLAQMLAKDPAERPASPQQIARTLARFAAGANLARLLDPTTTSNQFRARRGRVWSIVSALVAIVLLPWTLLCGAGRVLCWLGRNSITVQPAAPKRREPLVSFGGLLLIVGLAALLALSGFSCVPLEQHGHWTRPPSAHESCPTPKTWETGEFSVTWE